MSCCANIYYSERGALPVEQLAGVEPGADEQPEPGVHAWEAGLARARIMTSSSKS